MKDRKNVKARVRKEEEEEKQNSSETEKDTLVGLKSRFCIFYVRVFLHEPITLRAFGLSERNYQF